MSTLLRRLGRFAKDGVINSRRLILLSDPARGFPLYIQAARAPAGAIVIERTFGARPSELGNVEDAQAVILATVSQGEFRKARLDGIHWPHKRLALRKRSKVHGEIETASAHRGLEIATALRCGISDILISTAFASNSPSAKRPLGPVRLASLARQFPRARLYALGGVTARKVTRLSSTGLFGIAGVELGQSKKPNPKAPKT